MDQWGKKNVVDFYINNRNKLSDIYPSEKIPLQIIKRDKVNSILDFGCAVGGFYQIFKKLSIVCKSSTVLNKRSSKSIELAIINFFSLLE